MSPTQTALTRAESQAASPRTGTCCSFPICTRSDYGIPGGTCKLTARRMKMMPFGGSSLRNPSEVAELGAAVRDELRCDPRRRGDTERQLAAQGRFCVNCREHLKLMAAISVTGGTNKSMPSIHEHDAAHPVVWKRKNGSGQPKRNKLLESRLFPVPADNPMLE